jgi:lysophospholipase L1-like esterase
VTPRQTRFLLVFGSAFAAAFAFAWFRHEREAEPASELTLAPSRLDWGGVPASTDPRPGLDPLAADDSARFPPSILVRRTLTPEEVAQLFTLDEREFDVYDPHCQFIKKPGLDGERAWPEHPAGRYTYHTNSLGLRGAADPAAVQPDLRVLVVGDSHTEGVCSDDETFTAELERRLRAAHAGRSIEALNAARGGYSFYQYLGTLERLLALAPDVFVVAIYGGNDFEEALTLQHFFQGTARPPSQSFEALRAETMKAHGSAIGQSLNGCKTFTVWPDQIEVALQAARDCCTEIRAQCLRASIRPVFVYLPAAVDIELERHPKLREALEMLELSQDDVRSQDRMADSLLAFLRATNADVLDLRPAFRAAKEPLYWHADLHMNLAAHKLVSDALVAWIEQHGLATRARVRAAPAKPH